MRRLSVLLALPVVALAVAASALAGSTSTPLAATACSIQLRVDVFGGPVSWARQAGLTTGHAATLRAVARGCTVDHITGRRVGHPSAAPLGHSCSAATCFWRIQSAGMQAVDFQAFSPAHVRSNIVRVAWAGGDSVVGTWTWQYAQPGQALATHGSVTFSESGSTKTMTWSQGGGGTWERSGHTVTLTWAKGSVDTLTLSADGRRMAGTNRSGWTVVGIRQ